MLTLILKATNACNLRCLYCSLGDKSNVHYMSEGEMTKALEWFVQYALDRKERSVSIIFHGGEPMLIPAKQYELCIKNLLINHKEIDFSFYMQTNGTLLTGEYIDLIKAYDIHIGVSLDGLAKVHDHQRKSITQEETFAQVMENILWLKENNLSVSALMVLTKYTLEVDLHYLDEFSRLNLPIKINPLLNIGDAVEHNELALFPGDYGKYLTRVFSYLIEHELDIPVSPLEDIFHAILNEDTPKGCTFTAECNRFFVCIDQVGNIYPCGRFADCHSYQIGDVQKGITEHGKNILKLLRGRRCISLPEDCRACRFKNLCHGGCSASVSAMNALDKPTVMCQDYKEIFTYLYGDGLQNYKNYLLRKKEETITTVEGIGKRMDYEILLLNIARNASERAVHFQECLGQHLIASYISQFDYKAKVYSGDVLTCKEIIEQEIDVHNVKIIGFYAGADTIVMVGNIIKWLKKNKDVLVIVGGPEAYALNEKFLRETGCDYIIPGEGEIPVLNLLRYAVDGVGKPQKIKSLRFLNANGEYCCNPLEELIMDLDSIPFPDAKNSLNKRFRKGESMGILTGRGCPYHCGFCFEGAASKQVRLRSMENVIQEIEYVRESNKQLRCVNVYDDTFTLNQERVRCFCRYMKENGLLWSCEGHVSMLYHYPDMITEMVQSGLIAMQIGIESGSQKVLDAYKKNITPEMIKEVVKNCKNAGLLTLEGNYIIGGAWESEETIQESIQHAKELIELGHGMIELSTVFFSPYYGTPITKEPERYGMKIETLYQEHTVISMRDAVVSTNNLSVSDISRIKHQFDEELKLKYYSEAGKCTRKELLQGANFHNRKLRINQNWCAAWDNYPYIKEFTRHMTLSEQECEKTKYPIRTIGGYCLENEKFVAQGIEVGGLFKDALMLSDGKRTIEEIAEDLECNLEILLTIYVKLNDQCLVYFSEF